jgi:hypothetical protein
MHSESELRSDPDLVSCSLTQSGSPQFPGVQLGGGIDLSRRNLMRGARAAARPASGAPRIEDRFAGGATGQPVLQQWNPERSLRILQFFDRGWRCKGF